MLDSRGSVAWGFVVVVVFGHVFFWGGGVLDGGIVGFFGFLLGLGWGMERLEGMGMGETREGG